MKFRGIETLCKRGRRVYADPRRIACRAARVWPDALSCGRSIRTERLAPANTGAYMAGEAGIDFDEGKLDLGDGHAIYWRAQGPRDMPAMLVVHGGPGGAMNLKWAEVLDASKWRIVFFDQRGCGKSTPFGKLEHNGIDALVGDMEKLRTLLGIERWALFGGSWGTTLGLAYGVAHPE